MHLLYVYFCAVSISFRTVGRACNALVTQQGRTLHCTQITTQGKTWAKVIPFSFGFFSASVLGFFPPQEGRKEATKEERKEERDEATKEGRKGGRRKEGRKEGSNERKEGRNEEGEEEREEGRKEGREEEREEGRKK